MTSSSHCQTSPAAHGSIQKFDNDYNVIFMCYKYNIDCHGISVNHNLT